jgi:hypothetical protein
MKSVESLARLQVYAAGILTPAADAATASGEPLSHIRVDLHRNPFTEALDVSDIRYVAEDAGRCYTSVITS